MGRQTPDDRSKNISRRDFLKAAALGAAAASVGPFFGGPATRSADAAASAGQQKGATVVDARSPKWRVNGQVDAAYVKSMIDYGVGRLANKNDLAEAWRTFVKPTDVVGVKFNNLSYNYTNANQAIVDAITASLITAGVDKDKIIVTEAVGATWHNAITPRTRPYGEPMSIGNGKAVGLSPFITEQVDVLINVPNIKDHGSAGITGCLKNISHSHTIMSRPMHDDSCSPAIVGVNALEPIRTKRRLNIVNGLLGVFNGGPGVRRRDCQWEHNGFLFATDPVACDRVQLELINAERKRRGLPDLFDRHNKPKHVQNAAEAGLGTADLDKINWIKVIEGNDEEAAR